MWEKEEHGIIKETYRPWGVKKEHSIIIKRKKKLQSCIIMQ